AQLALTIAPGGWRIEQVNANFTGGAASSAEFQRRRGPELAQINAARRVAVTSDGWRQRFIWPVRGRVSGLFGAQRVYRGQPGSYHSGVDVAVPTGTELVAPADGVVTLAASSPFTLEGYLLIIDHGMGLNSAFLHNSSLAVREGDVVRQGQVIARVGATGRASGPHMHWGMRWRDARIDPARLAGPMTTAAPPQRP
ncbi:MAG: M23 family metallopeptidase, partial [Sphingomonadales bacterium]|nr:M23 family metallopeptidase [Sphingomonadales bacterium]